MICRDLETTASLYALLRVSRTGVRHFRVGWLSVTSCNADKNAETCSSSKSRLMGFRDVPLFTGKLLSGMTMAIRYLEWLVRLASCVA